MAMFKGVARWAHGLIGGVIGSGASTLAAALGLASANAVGVEVKPLEPNQMLAVFVSGLIAGAVLYLMRSPIPPLADDDTEANKPS